MDRKLHFLDSFTAHGTDGQAYRIFAYEHLLRDDSLLTDGRDHWEPTGQIEYRLDRGDRVDLQPDGSFRLIGADLTLTRPVGEPAGVA